MVKHITANKERGDRKDRLYGPRYIPTLEYNKFHYTAGLTLPNSITIPTIQPIPDHNLALLVVLHPSIQGCKSALRNREHNKHYPRYTPTLEYKMFNYTAGITGPNSITRDTPLEPRPVGRRTPRRETHEIGHVK